jgi:tight adherence protein C
MDAIFDQLSIFGDNANLIVGVSVFIATALVAFGVMAAVRLHGSVRRRAAGMTNDIESEEGGGGANSLRSSSLRAAQRLIELTTKHYSTLDDHNMKLLRRRLVQAGIFDPRGVGFFFLARVVLAVGLAFGAFVLMPIVAPQAESSFWLAVVAAGLLGYLAPTFVIDRMISVRQREYRAGFPDFMDLLVVCADAGLAMEAALERVGRELGTSYPALSANIHMTNLEIRAGRTMTEALEHFGDRLGLDEVRSFATLIQQSAELGSSITDALRVYSDDMRHKRLSIAEEKAYSLPAKLSVPLMLCVFPVLFVVILLPVVVRLQLGLY